MGESTGSCVVCGCEEHSGAGLSRVIIEMRSLLLCRTHAATVVAEMPETFEELRALFAGVSPPGNTAYSGPERRSAIPRRAPEDRRVFPPRAEGRRRSGGRRATDPLE